MRVKRWSGIFTSSKEGEEYEGKAGLRVPQPTVPPSAPDEALATPDLEDFKSEDVGTFPCLTFFHT